MLVMPIFELYFESYRVLPGDVPIYGFKVEVFFIIGSTPAYSFKIFNMIMPLNQTQLNFFQVFYFVHMGDSLKSFKIKDYKLSTELLLSVFLRYLLFYCCHFQMCYSVIDDCPCPCHSHADYDYCEHRLYDEQ